MSGYKNLIKNVGLLTLSNFATKLLSFFLVPLYTSVLTTGEYGTYDLFNTTVSLLVPLLTIDIQEAVLRFSMDKDAKHGEIFSIGCLFSMYSCLIVFCGLIINQVLNFSVVLQQFSLEFMLLYVLSAFSGVILYFARGAGYIAELSVSGVISSVVMISCNIVFLLVFKIGLHGYFYASILGYTAQCSYLLLKTRAYKYTKLKIKNVSLKKEMTEYSSPMVANAISWWINNASDRYIVTWMCNLSVTGIYSVSYKIPSIMSILQGIFSQAWTLSATKEFDSEDKEGFFINIYNVYNFLLILACSGLIFLDKPIAKILFAKDFYKAWEYAPFLMISTIFSGMAGFLGGILSALKQSKLFAKSSVITAIVNTVLNVVLVCFIGPIGAAISTAIAYFMMWYIRYFQIRKSISLRVNLRRDMIAYFILIVQTLLLLTVNKERIFCWYEIVFMLIIILLFKNEMRIMCGKVNAKIFGRK